MIRGLGARLARDVAAARMLRRAGVKLSSVVAYPWRRRHGDIRLTFSDGITLIAPKDEPLLNLVREIWIEERYPLTNLRDGDVVVDVGAHIGTFAVWAASKRPASRIICVEPSPVAAGYLRVNLANNGMKNVVVVEAACAAENGERRLHKRGVLAMNTLFAPAMEGEGDPVTCVTLEQLFERFGIRRCALLKLDCEGAEYEILFSTSGATLQRVVEIEMEYHRSLAPYDESALATYLGGFGYSVTVGPLEDDEGGYLYASRRSTGPGRRAGP